MRLHLTAFVVFTGAAVAALAGARPTAIDAQPDQEHAVAMECRGALWKKTFDEATAAGLNPGAIAVDFTAANAQRRVSGGDIVLTGVEDYRPTHEVAAFPVRYTCRVDRASGKVRDVSYVAIDKDGQDVARPPVQLVKEGRLLKSCTDRLVSGLADDVRRRGVSSPSPVVEIAPADAEFVSKGNVTEIQGRGRARYDSGFDWQVLIFQCRYDMKKQQVTRETHALETPSPVDALPADSPQALDACRNAAGQEVLTEAMTRGYRRLSRVDVELSELANVKRRGALLDIQGRGQFRLDPRHRQPTPLTFTCTYDTRAATIVSAKVVVEAGSWTPSGEIANGPTGTLRCGSRGLRREECPANIRGNVRIIRETGQTRCEAYKNWMWSSERIVVWDGCVAEFEYDAR